MKNKSVLKNEENKTQNKEIKNLKKDKIKNNSLFNKNNKNNRSNKEESKYKIFLFLLFKNKINSKKNETRMVELQHKKKHQRI